MLFLCFILDSAETSNAGALGPNGKARRPRLTAGLLSQETTDEKGGDNDVVTSVCLPRAVAPDIVPVILAFLYTDRLESDPENGSDGYSEAYTDPGTGSGVEVGLGMGEAYRQLGKRGFGDEGGGAGFGGGGGKTGGSGKGWVEGTPSEVGGGMGRRGRKGGGVYSRRGGGGIYKRVRGRVGNGRRVCEGAGSKVWQRKVVKRSGSESSVTSVR